jgi:hypothetical protein
MGAVPRHFKQIQRTLAALSCYSDGAYGRRMDAGETMTFARQLENIQVEIVEALYPTLKARKLIPFAGNVNPGAQIYTWREYDRLGLAKLLSNYATDLPSVKMFGKENKSDIVGIGVSFDYSIQDVRAAAMANLPLEAREGILAREAIERKIEQIAAHGDAEANVPGFFTNSNVPILSSGITGGWSSASAATILADMHAFAFGVWNQSLQIHEPNTIAINGENYAIIASKPWSTTGSPETILEVFLKSNPYIKEVEPWIECNSSAANGTSPRAVCYQKDPTVLRLVVPVEFETFPPQPKDLMFHVPCHGRIGGTVIERPYAMAYCDLF